MKMEWVSFSAMDDDHKGVAVIELGKIWEMQRVCYRGGINEGLRT